MGDDLAGLGYGFGGNLRAIGTHIGNQAGFFAIDGHALIQKLCHLHGAFGVKAKFAAGFLLQGRGGKWRRWIALARFAFNPLNRKAGIGDGGFGFARGRLIAQRKLV